MKKLLMLPLVAGLAGCGGASTSGSNAFGALIDDYTALLGVVGDPDSPGLRTTPEEDLPSGEVSYDGVISISERETPGDPVVFSALGSFSATVDFANPDGIELRGRTLFAAANTRAVKVKLNQDFSEGTYNFLSPKS